MASTFSKLKRAAPPRPDYTCPDINTAQAKCVELVRALTDLHKTLNEFSNKLYGPLEELRTSNEQLRSWGQYWKDTAETQTTELDKLKPPPSPEKRTPKRRSR